VLAQFSGIIKKEGGNIRSMSLLRARYKLHYAVIKSTTDIHLRPEGQIQPAVPQEKERLLGKGGEPAIRVISLPALGKGSKN
jgi:hypothetical protein